MSAPLPPPGPFRVPSVNAFVPRVIQPWIYLLMALSFQLSGGRYLGALNYMIGEEQLMREDLLMALWCNLAGMATLFPLMFRLKFRFTNKTLLRAAALGVLVCIFSSRMSTACRCSGCCVSSKASASSKAHSNVCPPCNSGSRRHAISASSSLCFTSSSSEP